MYDFLILVHHSWFSSAYIDLSGFRRPGFVQFEVIGGGLLDIN
jgi:hypothetical protein